ncbi:MAG: FAD binding domain-containing protein [Anaerolineae bacterium]
MPLFVTGAQVAEVEVDLRTGETRVLRVAAAHDVGRVVNRLDAEGQIEGAMLMGLGAALMEEVLPGHTRGLADYYLPTAKSMPQTDVILVEVPGLHGPHGVKGLGEAAMLPATPAIINAISRAIGTRLREIPATPERVLRAINESANRRISESTNRRISEPANDEMTEYLMPDTVEEVLHILTRYAGRARVIAGGTDVLPDLRKGKYAPACLVDVTRIPELTRIEIEAKESEDVASQTKFQDSQSGLEALAGLSGLREKPAEASIPKNHLNAHRKGGYVTVGAAVTFAMLRKHPYLQQHVHALVEAAASVGAAPIQSVATWAGNLVQAMLAADGAISAIALDAELHVVDADGGRWLPVLSTFLGPGRSAIDPTRQLVTAIRFAIPATPWDTAWRRAGRRPSLILPTLNCAVKLVLDEDGHRITQAAIALGPVATCPHRAAEAEAFLVGRPPSPETFAEAARLAQHSADPRTSIHCASREYRLAILPMLVEEALGVAERAKDTSC